MGEKRPTHPADTSIARLQARCSSVSNQSARVSLNLEKLAARGASQTVGQMKVLASTVGDFVQEMDMLAVLLEGTGLLADASRRHLEVLISDAEELASLTSSVLSHGRDLGSAQLEKLVATEKTWKMMLQLVTSFQSLVQIQDEEDAAQVLEMTTSDFDELQRMISRVQITEPPSQASPAFPPEPRTSEDGPPDYNTAVSSPITTEAPITVASPSTPSATPEYQKDPRILAPEEEGHSFSASASASASTKPKRGKVGVFFRSLSSKFVSPVEPLVTPLCQAAEAGNISHVRGLLLQGANPNGVNDEGYTPLTAAIHSDTNPDPLETVRFLLDHGAKITSRDAIWSLPPLWHACRAGRAEIADFLISRGADPKGRNTYGALYFVDVVEKDPPHILELLLRRGADSNAVSLTGKKVVASTVEANDMTKTRILLDAGASVTATNTTGHSLLAIALANKNLEMATFLIDHGAKAAGKNGYGDALISLAVAPDFLPMATLLLAHGADPNAKSITGQPCVVSAVQQDLVDTTRLLLDHGADSNAKDITGRPVLALAIIQQRYDHATLLLEHGADPSIPGNRSGSTHLLVTHLRNASTNQADFLRLMLRLGAKPDVMPSSWDSNGAHTPLGYCVKESLPALVSILLEGGADPHRAGQTGTTPFSEPLAKDTPFRLAVSLGRTECVRAMLDAGAVAGLRGGTVDVDEVLLQAAAAAESREVVDMLLDEGVQRPPYAAAFAEREGRAVLREALAERVRKHGLDAGWFRYPRGETDGWAARGAEAPPAYDV